MAGKVFATLLSISFFVYFILSGISFYMYTGINERVNDICYDVAETVSTKGVLSKEIYTYLCEDLSKYGDFHVELKLELSVETGRPDTYFDNKDIIDRALMTGDRLLIAVHCQDPVLFEKLTGVYLRPAALKVCIIT